MCVCARAVLSARVCTGVAVADVDGHRAVGADVQFAVEKKDVHKIAVAPQNLPFASLLA